MPFAAFRTYEPTLEDWTAGCGTQLRFLATGTCSDELRFLYFGTGFTTEVRYFDSAGRFVGLATETDVIDWVCQGATYWPEPTQCEEPVITSVPCGGPLPPGESIELPWADGTGNPPKRITLPDEG